MSSAEITSRFGKPYRPRAVALANRMGRALSKLGIGGKPITVGGVLSDARRKAGLDDFGDQGFLEPLEVLVDSINGEARLNPVGHMIIRGRIVGVLTNKLVARESIKRHPEILDIPVEAPIVIAGLARTGTTMLHRLIAQDPAIRSLASWEAINPAPARRSAGQKKDPRFAQAAAAAKGLKYMSPGFFAIHPAEPDAPEEEVILLEQAFLTTTPEAMMNVPTYSKWLEEQNHVPAYRALRRMMQYLQWQRPGIGKTVRWVLKTPHHQEYFDPLLEVFPKALLVHTHRDPLKTSPSLFSMLTHLQMIFSDEVDPNRVAGHWLGKIENMARRTMATRERVGDEGFIDVSYYDLIEDALPQVSRIYEAAGLELTAPTIRLMQASQKVNKQHKYGRHKYSLADFGMTDSDVESRIAPYRARFNVPYE
ncbi:MAG: sulfotransferase [Deltaproteobacteria bacterium]|nr:sulfotransferase [Deltaproteobacteria bacterium]MBT8463657.1 sulfotransferase [Deltaproteobacteria bacterium]NND28736.1 sulfotransferase [Myxococcales bacterium]NNK06908.1 sulfotransferase [Myxococcales bacterium]NNK43222.1 sulfotransferase [Myxococcales bacterium]